MITPRYEGAAVQLLKQIADRVRRDYFRSQYRRAVKSILASAPLARGVQPFMLLSMVHQRDVLSYLVAVKSFCKFLQPERIVIVCDPSISGTDRTLIKQHVPHVELRDAKEFEHPTIPRGGCWERLSAISILSRESYIVQLDADTVTLRPVVEVSAAIREQRGFVLGEMPDTPSRSLAAVREYALPWIEPGAHIQAVAETEMANVGLPADACYIRGCAAFTGFPRSTTMRAAMLDYSGRMSARVGEEWNRWGSEQVASNYLVSNANGTEALPFPKYATPDCATTETAFYHFIGSMRFINNEYANITRHAILSLGATTAT